MEILHNSVILVICLIAIGKGAIWLVDSSSKLAKRFGVSEIIIGLTVVAFGTSAPEFGVTITAACRGMAEISVGNIVGSNIFNLGIILGCAAIIQNLKVRNEIVYRDGLFLLIGSVLLALFLIDLKLSKFEGTFLFSLLILYLFHIYFNRKDTIEVKITSGSFSWVDFMLLITGLALLLVGSHFLVMSASYLAKALGVSQWLIGATIVAAGTSAPELATSIIAAMKGHHEISIGNLIGSDIFNLFGALGLAAILRDLHMETMARTSVIYLVIMIFFVLVFLRTEWTLSRREGVVLVVFGCARWIYSFFLQ